MALSIKGFRDTEGFNVIEKGYRHVATAGTTQDFHVKYNENVYMEGMRLWCGPTAVDTDCVDVLIVDVDNILGLGPDYLLATMAKAKYVRPNFEYMRLADSIKLIPIGIYICLKYHSTGSQDVVVHLDHLLRITDTVL